MGEKRYTRKDIDVTYSLKRCIHAAECVRGLPAVFDTDKRPWIQPDQATADEIAAVVARCPSGALHYERKASEQQEPTPARNTVELRVNGPLYLRGDLEVIMPDGAVLTRDVRLALCRCGASENKPFCDNTHREIGFKASDPVGEDGASGESPATGTLTVKPSLNGPLLLRGNFEIRTASGELVSRATRGALCRCGGSGNKPFCDGTHRKIGFKSESE